MLVLTDHLVLYAVSCDAKHTSHLVLFIIKLGSLIFFILRSLEPLSYYILEEYIHIHLLSSENRYYPNVLH